MHDGVKVQIGDAEYVVPSLTLAQVRRFHEDGTLAKVPQHGVGFILSLENQDAALSVIVAALKRNYPDITREAIEERVDLVGVGKIIAAVLGAAGLGRSAGEAPASH